MIPVPKHNNVLLKQIEIEQKQYGSIMIADLGNEKALYGEILAIGPGTYSISGVYLPMQCKVGEKVIIPSFGGQRIKYEGEEYIIMKDQDILCNF